MITRISMKLAACVVATLFSFGAKAQRTQRHATPVPAPSIAQQYSDSLTFYRHKLDSLMAANDSLRDNNNLSADSRYYRIFAPTTYYSDIFGKRFSIKGGEATEVDHALSSLYFRRPDLVRYTDTQLDNQSSTPQVNEDQQPERIEMTKQVTTPATPAAADVTKDLGDTSMNLYVEKPHFWTFKGDYFLQFMQNAFSSNWYKGGSNSYSMLGQVTLQYNYNNKQRIKWDNKLEMKLGFQANEADTVNRFKASDDLLRYTGRFGLQAHKKWYYTLQLLAKTQFARSLRNNDTKTYSDFMSPFNLEVSLGMDYSVATKNNKLTGSIHLAPLAFKFTYCDRWDLAASQGIRGDHRTMEDFGSTYTVELVWKPINFFTWQTRMYGYTTYHKYEMDWENTFTFTFNKYISAKVFLHPRFDDGVTRMEDHDYFQYKEWMSLGFSYSM